MTRKIAIISEFDKAPVGQKCNGCGWCCTVSKCAGAVALFGFRHKGRCKLLNNDKQCTVLTKQAISHFSEPDQKEIIRIFKKINAVGKGCDAVNNWEPLSVEQFSWLSDIREKFFKNTTLLYKLKFFRRFA